MFRFVILITLIYLLYKIIVKVNQHKTEINENMQCKSKSPSGEDLIEDPVCHTYVPVSQSYKKEISGKDYYFCSKQCSDQYSIEKNN